MTDRSGYTLTASLCVAAALAGCDNPFKTYPSDYGLKAPPEKLREVHPLKIERFQAPPDTTVPDPQALAANRFAGLPETRLTIEEARAAVLENNLDLRVALIDPTIAGERLSEEEARFEAVFTTRVLWDKLNNPTSSELQSAREEDRQFEPGVRIPTRNGTTAVISLPITSTETNNSFSTLNPAVSTDLRFSISQPLLRGAGRRANTHPIRIAAYNAQISQAQTKLEAIRQLAAVDRSYWRLYQARRALEVRQQQLEFAQAQLDRAQRFNAAGVSPEIEVIRAQAGVADGLDGIIQAQNVVLTQQRELKRIMNMAALSIETKTAIIPATPPDPVQYIIDPLSLADEAVSNRMEMLELELQLASDVSSIDFARNQALPLITLDYSYQFNSLGQDIPASLGVLRRGEFRTWSVGLNAEIPIGNDAAKARVQQAILTRLQRLGTKEARRLAIRQEVFNTVDQIDAGWERIIATRQSVILNTRALAAEQRQFEVGASTSTNVLDQTARLAVAQLQEVQAIADYQVAQVDLSFSTGTLLGASRIRWDPLDPRKEGSRPVITAPADAGPPRS
jgi:outer membrane protein